ncbi:MAG TPA: cation-transporting P-type ATPase, partial [Microbacterium sp.]|nr:cation-transporting P-type ATPase [Microbacterium sp.]
MTTATGGSTETPWFAQDADAVVAAAATDRDAGLTGAEAERRLAEHGPNAIASEPPPSVWQVALRQLADPMNVMLVAVAIISLFINQVSVGILVGALVILNVFLGTRQEMKAKASVDALAKMQIPKAKVIRDGVLLQVDATSLVPGDIITLEAGDIVPADGRIIRSATLETQEAALTGESAPIAKDAAVIADPGTTLGDRAN